MDKDGSKVEVVEGLGAGATKESSVSDVLFHDEIVAADCVDRGVVDSTTPLRYRAMINKRMILTAINFHCFFIITLECWITCGIDLSNVLTL